MENILYYRAIEKFTTLYVEREDACGINVFSFYKMRRLPNGRTTFKTYCDCAPLVEALKRIDSFVDYLELNKNQTGRWFT